jgi:hypothetical protein
VEILPMSEKPLPQASARETIEHLDGSITEYSYFEPSAEAMEKLVKVLFEYHWHEVTVGPCVEGAAFEVRFSEAPKLSIVPHAVVRDNVR